MVVMFKAWLAISRNGSTDRHQFVDRDGVDERGGWLASRDFQTRDEIRWPAASRQMFDNFCVKWVIPIRHGLDVVLFWFELNLREPGFLRHAFCVAHQHGTRNASDERFDHLQNFSRQRPKQRQV